MSESAEIVEQCGELRDSAYASLKNEQRLSISTLYEQIYLNIIFTPLFNSTSYSHKSQVAVTSLHFPLHLLVKSVNNIHADLSSRK